MAIYIESFLSNKMDNFSYLIIDSINNKVVIIDPSFNVHELLTFIHKENLDIHSVWLTHTHFDHIVGLDEVMSIKTDCPIYVFYESGSKFKEYDTVMLLNDGDTINFGGANWKVFYTPGHSSDGICFYSNPHLITGDTLFIDRCGRADLADSNVNDLYESLARLKEFPHDTIIYPGHNYGLTKTDTIGNQIKQNPYLSVNNKSEFIRLRMGR